MLDPSLSLPVDMPSFWKGRGENEDRIHGVGLAIKTGLMKHLSDLPVGINERIMKPHLPFSQMQHTIVISTYAPTMTSTEEIIEQVYADLSSTLCFVPVNDKLNLLGDFNTHSGCDHSQ